MEYSQARTYRLTPGTIRRLDDLAAAVNIYQSTLVDALLSHALDDIDAGRLAIQVRPVKYELDRIERR